MPEGLLIVISAPSGGGKGTILKELFAQDANLRLSVSATTRQPRPGEENGKQYYFISHEEFQDLIKTGKMLEYTEYCGNFYGTPKAPVEEWTQKGFDVVLEIEVDGGAQIKKLMPDCVSVFILPPSMKVLEKRLRKTAAQRMNPPYCAGWKRREWKFPAPRITIILCLTISLRMLWQTCRLFSKRKK